MNRRITTAALAALLLAPALQGAHARQRAMPGHGADAGMRHQAHGMAGGWGPGEGCGPGMPGPDWSAITLTGPQRTRIDAIHNDLRTRQAALMDRTHAAMRSAKAYHDGSFDEAALRAAYAQADQAHRQMLDNRLEALRQIDAVLTPQQRQQLSQANR